MYEYACIEIRTSMITECNYLMLLTYDEYAIPYIEAWCSLLIHLVNRHDTRTSIGTMLHI